MDEQIEYIKWIDSFGCSAGWETIDDLKQGIVMECHSVGYVMDENDDYVLLVPHCHGEIKLSENKQTQNPAAATWPSPKPPS